MTATAPPSTYLAERIQDAQRLIDRLEYELANLRDESWTWRDWYEGAVAKEGTEREMQERAEVECASALDIAREHLDGLIKQARGAAMQRQENGD